MNYDENVVYIVNCSSDFDFGLIFVCNLLFDNLVDRAVKKASKTLGMIKMTFTCLSIYVNILHQKN